MKKLQSTLKNMVTVLGATTIIAGALLGAVNNLTADARAKAEQQKRQEALKAVAGQFDNDPMAESATITLADGATATVYPARVNGSLTAAAVESTSNDGFSGEIKILTGFDDKGQIIGYEVLSQSETPGLGAKMVDWFSGTGNRSVIGRKPLSTPLIVSKDGGDVDAITAATISSRAFLEAVNTAAEAFDIYLKKEASL